MTAEHHLAEDLLGTTEDDAPSGANLALPHPATDFFSKKFQELASATNVRLLDTGEVHRISPLTIHRMLLEQAPDLALSQRQVYRYYNGDAAPRIDVVYELARLFGVSPRDFLPDHTDGAGS